MPAARLSHLPSWLARPVPRLPIAWRRASRFVGAALVLSGGWTMGWLGLSLGALGLLCWWLPDHGASAAASDADTPQGPAVAATPADSARGLHALVHDVTDEWSKQLSLGRTLNQQGLEGLLSTFSTLSELIGSVTAQLANFKPNVAAGVIGDAVDAQRPALDELMTPLKRAFAQREEMRQQLKQCIDALCQLQQWSKDARELAQHTRMVAFNASIEAVRGCGGSPEEMSARQTISTEIGRVSRSIVALCDAMDQMVQPLHQAGHQMQQAALIQDTNDEELRLELELRARHAISAMFESLGGSIASGSDLQQASDALAAQVDQAFTEFQFGDRVEQLLQILNRDIDRLYEFSAKGIEPEPQDIRRWLDELAASYTMDEQRSQHHNTELIDRGSRVEFF